MWTLIETLLILLNYTPACAYSLHAPTCMYLGYILSDTSCYFFNTMFHCLILSKFLHLFLHYSCKRR